MSWLATHGIGVIKDTDAHLKIKAIAGSARIQPVDSESTKGVVHFTIPSPAGSNSNLKDIQLDFSSHSATVETINIYLANSSIFSKIDLQKLDSFNLTLDNGIPYNGKGISVAVGLQFDNKDSHLDFQSVGIQLTWAPRRLEIWRVCCIGIIAQVHRSNGRRQWECSLDLGIDAKPSF